MKLTSISGSKAVLVPEEGLEGSRVAITVPRPKPNRKPLSGPEEGCSCT